MKEANFLLLEPRWKYIAQRVAKLLSKANSRETSSGSNGHDPPL